VFYGKKVHRDMADIHVYTAMKLSGMAKSLEGLARTFDREKRPGNLSREDGLAALQMAGAMVCGECSKCNLYSDSEKEDSYYLYYLLRAFEQKGTVDCDDMPRLFRETCSRQEAYVGQLNRNLGRATMNLTWKNRFLESRDTVITQFRELAVILEEFARQIPVILFIQKRKCHNRTVKSIEQILCSYHPRLMAEYQTENPDAVVDHFQARTGTDTHKKQMCFIADTVAHTPSLPEQPVKQGFSCLAVGFIG